MLVHVGRVAHEKNIDFLLDVLHSLRGRYADVLLVIAGEGPAQASLQTRVEREELQQHVLFVDYLPRGEPLWDCYRAGDVFVFASATETQGLVLLEAMALGIPVVSTARMGTKDILADGRGALVSDGTLADFADKVCSVLARPELRRQLAQEAREYAREWSAGKMAQRLAGFYEHVAGGGEPCPVLETRDGAATG